MTNVINILITAWDQRCSTPVQEHALTAIEKGSVLFFPQLSFSIEEAERRLRSATIAGGSKNVSFDISTGKLWGAVVARPGQANPACLQQRKSPRAESLLEDRRII